MGRSMPPTSDGIITTKTLKVNGKDWTTYAVGGTPAQTVQHAVLEIMPTTPDLVVAGINYGTNFGTGVTISGTVGAAMEGASHGKPALAVSLETEHKYHLSHSGDIDFKPAAHFTNLFASMLLTKGFPEDMHVLKIEVPSDASINTPWVMTKLSRIRFYLATKPNRKSWSEPGSTGYEQVPKTSAFEEDSDVYAVVAKRQVAVTPVTTDLTARVDFRDLEKKLRKN
jgi:5'-nucleotidase